MAAEHRRVSVPTVTPSWLQEIRNYWAEVTQRQVEGVPQTDGGTTDGTRGERWEQSSEPPATDGCDAPDVCVEEHCESLTV